MKFYSTNNRKVRSTLKEAVLRGLAEDSGLYMPERIPAVGRDFIRNIGQYSFGEISLEIAGKYFGEDVPEADLAGIVKGALDFDAPLVSVHDRAWSLELFHGPTLAFKDVGARFMARLLGYFVKDLNREVHVLVATSGDTGSAVASGFYEVPGIRVHILYPSGKVSRIQEKQFTTLGKNITALEVDGNFDDCQRLVKAAFNDPELRSRLFLTSANSINVARLLPQTFYYFNLWARLPEHDKRVVVSVPSGNFGNLTAGLIAQQMGLPVSRFIAATNVNDVVPSYLANGVFSPRPSIETLANAMDVGNPSNFARMLDLYENSLRALRNILGSEVSTDEDMRETITEVWQNHGYLMEPHGATAYRSLQKHMNHGDAGVFLETAHPAKFPETVRQATGVNPEVPERLASLLGRAGQSVPMSSGYGDLKDYLLGQAG